MPSEQQSLTAALIRSLLYRREVALTRHRAALARSLGITDVEMQALVHLAQRGALAPSQIATLLDLSSGGATALVQRLERAGHVTREPHPTDRRSTLILLSARTAEQLGAAESRLDDGLDERIADLSEDERVVVMRFFSDVAALTEEVEASMRRDADTPPDPLLRPVPSLWA